MRGQWQQKKKLVKDEPIPGKTCRNPSSSSGIKRNTFGLYQPSSKRFVVF
jgi:hypothetical protein